MKFFLKRRNGKSEFSIIVFCNRFSIDSLYYDDRRCEALNYFGLPYFEKCNFSPNGCDICPHLKIVGDMHLFGYLKELEKEIKPKSNISFDSSTHYFQATNGNKVIVREFCKSPTFYSHTGNKKDCVFRDRGLTGNCSMCRYVQIAGNRGLWEHIVSSQEKFGVMRWFID